METKKSFQTYAGELSRLVKFTDRNDIDEATKAKKDAIIAIYNALLRKRKHSDNTDLMVEIHNIIKDYVSIEHQESSDTVSKQFDISGIDFDILAREFARKKNKKLIIYDLDDLIQQRLQSMVLGNPTRIDYMDRYQEIISAYNSEQDRASIEKTFMDLMDLANSMDNEQQRYVREGFSSDEELTMYDMLFSENLTKEDIKAIKKVAVDLLAKIKEKISEFDHWTDKQETKAAVDNLIRDTLWAELPDCYDEVSISSYRQRVYEYVYTRYKDIA